MAKSYCIMCGNERKGISVAEDRVLGAVRWFKRNVTKDEKGNRLVVCKDCYAEYSKRRRAYESRQMLYLALGVAFFAISVAVSPSPVTVLIATAVLAGVYLLSLLSYTPKIAIEGAHHNQ
jgi:VIT1/CCC1 family predicted Fe2+/Mn2+ transporter